MAETPDDLFRLPPSEFTAARDALAKRLRADGRRDEAAEVKSLRRPTVAAWALNQVARTEPEAVERLIAAGEDVAAAQRRALSGVREAGLRDASQQRRSRIDEVWKVAAGILQDAGVEPASHRQAIADTLEAASLDEAAADALRAGRLSKELPAPSGFGAVAGFTVVPSDDTEDAPPAAAPDEEDPEHAARQAIAEAQRIAAAADEDASEAEARAGDARQSALRTEAEAQRLQERARDVRARADRLAQEADDLADRAAAARAAADDAARRLRELQEAAGG